MDEKRSQVALLILRVGLGFFLLMWSIDKIVLPGDTAKLFQVFYGMNLSPAVSYLIGVTEAALSVLIIIGAWKTYTYAIGIVLHSLSTLSTWRHLIYPFGHAHHLFLAAIPILTSFVALYMLRDRDVMWSVDRPKA